MLFEGNSIIIEADFKRVSFSSTSGQYVSYEAECMFEGLFYVARKVEKLQLTHVEIALYCAIALLIGKFV